MHENANMSPNIEGLSTLLILQDELKKLKNIIEFGYFTTNETHRLLRYHTGYLWQKSEILNVKLLAQSGIAEMDLQAPINQWLEELVDQLLHANLKRKLLSLTFDKQVREEQENVVITESQLNSWPKELPGFILWAPFLNDSNDISGGLLLFRETPFSDAELKMFQWLFNNYQYTWNAIVKPDIISIKKFLSNKIYKKIFVLLLVAATFCPIRLSVLATATVESKNPALINAPIPGVIGKFFVKPGDNVLKGQLLLVLDDKDLSNSVDVNQKKVMLTEAKLRSTVNESFTKQSSKSEIPILQEEIKVNKAELNYTKSLLQKTNIISPIDGVAVFNSKEDWVGQPVQTGENILSIADPNNVQLKIILPVSDLITLETGSEGKFYLYGQLSEIPVVISSLSYNAKLMPNKILAYQLIAQFSNHNDLPHLGSQGNVRLYGKYVPVIYYLLRRPLQAFRQTFGI